MSDSGDEGPRQWEPPEGGTQPPPPPAQQPPPPPQQPPPPPPPHQWAPPPAAGYPYGYQPPQAYGYGQQTEGTAVAALVLAIASFVICPVITAVAALIVGANARKKIVQSGGRLGGLGPLTAAPNGARGNIRLAPPTVLAVIPPPL